MPVSRDRDIHSWSGGHPDSIVMQVVPQGRDASQGGYDSWLQSVLLLLVSGIRSIGGWGGRVPVELEVACTCRRASQQ